MILPVFPYVFRAPAVSAAEALSSGEPVRNGDGGDRQEMGGVEVKNLVLDTVQFLWLNSAQNVGRSSGGPTCI